MVKMHKIAAVKCKIHCGKFSVRTKTAKPMKRLMKTKRAKNNAIKIDFTINLYRPFPQLI